MRSHRFLAASAFLVLFACFACVTADAGKGKKPPKDSPSKSEPMEGGEPWVAGYTLSQWAKFYRSGDEKQKDRAADMIAWCCTQKKSADAAKVMVEVMDDPRHRLKACKAIADMHWEGRVAILAVVPWASSKETSTETRIAALTALGSVGLTKPGVLDVLMEGLHDRNDGIRRTAGYAIYRIGPDARPLVPRLIEALKDSEPVVAESAAIALSGIGPDAKDAAPALIAALKYPNYLVRRHVTEALQRLCSPDPAVHKALVAGLKDEHGEVNSGCVWAIHFCRDIGPEVVDGLCWALRHGNESMRYYAANAMSEHGIDAPQTIEPLIAALEDKKTRSVAATALGKRRPVTEKTLAALMAAFEKGHYERIAIADALGEMGPLAESTARRLRKGLDEMAREGSWSYELVHVALANALWKITKDRDMVPILGKLAQYPYDHHVTGRACMALGQIGPEAKAAIPALLANLKVKREVLGSARALVGIGAPEGEQALREMLAAPKREERLNAAYALWELRRDPKCLAELCDNGATHPDHHTRRHALMTVGQIELKSDEERELLVRRLAVALDDEQPYVQKEAARALARLGAEAAPTVRPLMRLLKSDSWSVADQAARTLGAIGPSASKALPELRLAAENPLLRAAAREAIKKIER